ncbi:hypothetical protein B7463_g7780, partial [Scytalidium lignicola]
MLPNTGKPCVVKTGQAYMPNGKWPVPSSKSYIRSLEGRIGQLVAEIYHLQQEKPEHCCVPHPSTVAQIEDHSLDPIDEGEELVLDQSGVDDIAGRLCSPRYQLNGDEDGQIHFYGPTSSLHVAFSMSSSLIPQRARRCTSAWKLGDEMSEELQNELLEAYFHSQNSIVHIVHEDAFRRDMESGQPTYFSKLLLYCIFAMAAVVSDRPDVRSLAVVTDDAEHTSDPYLVRKATELLQKELSWPQITTIQALHLLSNVEGAQGHDHKRMACRLVWDLELHRGCTDPEAPKFSTLDLEIRQMVTWASYTNERLRAFYLGRPTCMQYEAIKVPKPGASTAKPSWQMALSGAFIGLMEVLSSICGVLMQYLSARIVLHRPIASFGNSKEPLSPQGWSSTMQSRAKCKHCATQIAFILDDYEEAHGSAAKLSGISLHIISIAATALVATLASATMEAALSEVSGSAREIISPRETDKQDGLTDHEVLRPRGLASYGHLLIATALPDDGESNLTPQTNDINDQVVATSNGIHSHGANSYGVGSDGAGSCDAGFSNVASASDFIQGLQTNLITTPCDYGTTNDLAQMLNASFSLPIFSEWSPML